MVSKIVSNGKTIIITDAPMFRNDTTCKRHTREYWPKKGERVRVVYNDNGVLLFTKRQRGNYRFWSPILPWNTPQFYFKKPAMVLPGGTVNDVGNDGCSKLL